MMNVLNAALNFPSVIFTVLLGFALLFWVSVIIGGVDPGVLDGPDADFNADVDADGDLEADGHHEVSGVGGILTGVLGFLNIGKVPLSMIASIATLFAWMGSVILQMSAGPELAALMPVAVVGILVILASSFGSLLITGIVTRPMRGLFKIDTQRAEETIIDNVCTVVTSRVSGDFGQAQFETKGAPLTLSVRCRHTNKLAKGSKAVIIGYDPETNTYDVGELEPESESVAAEQKQILKKQARHVSAALKRAQS